ncbi:hypothetical protein C9374_012570 [Naegleria lovaniensis]|uniref:Uncharacterized protein n=1 Tax=Naegleria lovaniensis TaxID=51637 RepID=A0AA88KNN5_NAELO|nr:uncharacterized protein C9374_012570 [Naegleria lovaniensis]KAG2392318.1 hypothetical protein C9374_012570 [Naegleria lovaniensis]
MSFNNQRRALRDITNTSTGSIHNSSMMMMMNGSSQQAPLKSNNLLNTSHSSQLNQSLLPIMNHHTMKPPRESMIMKQQHTSSHHAKNKTSLLSNNMTLGSTTLNASSSNTSNTSNIQYMLNALYEFFSQENISMEITPKTFREGDTFKLRYFLNYLFTHLDRNICVLVPTPSEVRELEKKNTSSSGASGASGGGGSNTTTTSGSNSSNMDALNRRKTMMNHSSLSMMTISAFTTSSYFNKAPSISGLDEDLIIELVDFFKLPISLNKRHFTITPQSSRNWQTMIQVLFYLTGLVKYSREREMIERDLELQQVSIFFSFLSDMYAPFLEGNNREMERLLQEWRNKFNMDCARSRENLTQLKNLHESIKNRLNYFNTRQDPFHELEEKRMVLESQFLNLNESSQHNEEKLNQLLHDREITKAKLVSTNQQIDSKKRDNEVCTRQLEHQEITPLEAQALYREKSTYEEEEERILKRTEYTRNQVESAQRHLSQCNEQITTLTSQYNSIVLKIDPNLRLISLASNNAKWRIDDSKQKKAILKQQFTTLQSQIQQLNETLTQKDEMIQVLNEHLLDVKENLTQETISFNNLESLHAQIKQQHQEELFEYDRRIKTIEEQSVHIHAEKNRWKQEFENTELLIAQLEEEMQREEQEQIEQRNTLFNLSVFALQKAAEHKENAKKIINATEKTGSESFAAIRQLQIM